MSQDVDFPRGLTGPAGWLDDRFHGARGFRVLMRKVFPDHWSFMLGEIALWSFVVLLLTGVFLSFFFVPSMTDVVYHGSCTKLNGITMSEAYQSTLKISFDVRGGLLMRQIHHWAADLFMASLIIHMLRVFFGRRGPCGGRLSQPGAACPGPRPGRRSRRLMIGRRFSPHERRGCRRAEAQCAGVVRGSGM